MSSPAPKLQLLPRPIGQAHSAESRDGDTGFGPALAAWLATACQMIPDVAQAYVFVAAPGSAAATEEAVWPLGVNVEADMKAIATALAASNEVRQITSAGAGNVYLARRLQHGQGAHGALVLRLPQPPDAQRETLLRLIDWTEAWFRHLARPGRPATDELPLRLAVLDSGLAASGLVEAATAMAIALVAALGADSASIGLRRAGQLRLLACSHTAALDQQMSRNRALAAAMEEALDAGQPIVVTGQDGQANLATQAHDLFCRHERAGAVCTLPLDDGHGNVGALSLVRQRGEAFNAEDLSRLQAVSREVARVLRLRQAGEAPFSEQLGARLTRWFAATGLRTRTACAACALLLGTLLVVDGTYRVSAPASLHGSIERSLVAPLDGYVADASARAGDAVKKGDLLAMLDTKALEFERRRWLAERAEAEKTLRQAVAGLNRAEAAINKARVSRTVAQLALLDEQIRRARITAPFDGMVISGDLSREMGAPVSRGQVLFQIAPLDNYRVELAVSERDIASVMPGQTGSLTLTALPGEALPFTVERILGVATALDGHTVFKAEARLGGDVGRLRPGLEGVGRIDAGARPLWWVWTHALVDRVRLWLWSRAV